jgi:hypothetical protein
MSKQTVQVGKHTLHLPTDVNKLLDLCRSLPGWTVVRGGTRGWRISNGVAPPITVSDNLQNGRALPNAHQALIRMGVLKDWQAKLEDEIEQKEKEAQRSRKRNEELTAIAVKRSLTAPPPPVTVQELFMPPTPAAKAPATKSTAKASTTPEPYTEPEDITGKRAEELLTRPMPTLSDGRTLQQRTINQGWVNELERAMVEGRFRTTHQGIALAPEAPHNTGGVTDGQHRLYAIYQAAEKMGPDWYIRINVTRNANPDDFVVYDVAKTRTKAQMLHIGGEKNTHLLSSALKLLSVWNRWVEDPKAMADWMRWNRYSPGSDETDVLLMENPTIREDVRIAGAYVSNPLKISGAAIAVFRYHVRQEAPWVVTEDPDLRKSGLPMDEFLYRLKHGFGSDGQGHSDDPAIRLRNWFLDGNHKRTYVGQGPDRRLAPGREVALLKLIAMWNKWVTGDSSRLVKVIENEKMVLPKVPRKNARLT